MPKPKKPCHITILVDLNVNVNNIIKKKKKNVVLVPHTLACVFECGTSIIVCFTFATVSRLCDESWPHLVHTRTSLQRHL